MLDVFNSDPFSMVNLTAAVNEMPYVPQGVSRLGIFRERGVATTSVSIEKKGTTLSLIQTSPRGSPPEERVRDTRDIRVLNVPRIAKVAKVYAHQVQNVRQFGTENAFETVQGVVMDEVANVNLEADMTLENLRLGAVTGVILDADGSTIYDLFSEFGVSQLAEFDYELDDTNTDVRQKNADLLRLMGKELKMGAAVQTLMATALCSDGFFDVLIGHSSVKTAWERWNTGQALREQYAWNVFFHAGVLFINYRGTDDGTTVKVADDKAHFFPMNVPGLFDNVFAPADTMSTVNTIGLPRYAIPSIEPGTTDPRWMAVEVQSNPLPFCTRPRTLIKAKKQ